MQSPALLFGLLRNLRVVFGYEAPDGQVCTHSYCHCPAPIPQYAHLWHVCSLGADSVIGLPDLSCCHKSNIRWPLLLQLCLYSMKGASTGGTMYSSRCCVGSVLSTPLHIGFQLALCGRVGRVSVAVKAPLAADHSSNRDAIAAWGLLGCPCRWAVRAGDTYATVVPPTPVQWPNISQPAAPVMR